MPRTFGDATVHSSHFDAAVKVDVPLPDHAGKPPTHIEAEIGKLVAENLVEDGATLQMGIGSIPDSVLAQLHNHKDLGIHSEMFADGIVELVAKGCITNNHKTINKGKIIGSFLIGGQKLYDFVDNNPFICKFLFSKTE
jgi:acyl-CoA hydrolase